jgi:hypothetical protein
MDTGPFEKLTHGNYHAWAPHTKARLMELGISHFWIGDKIIPLKLTASVPAPNVLRTDITTLNREYKDDVCLYTDAICCNDKAIGMISNVIELNQFKHINGKETAKEAWDALKQKHTDSHTSLAAFYIKVDMLNKKYTDGESMHAHLSFFSTENCKLATKAFNDEFFVQIMLMSLPRNSTWETLVIALLQSTNNKNPLATVDITSQLMQKYRCLSGIDSVDSAMFISCHGGKSNSSKPSKPLCKRCGYC